MLPPGGFPELPAPPPAMSELEGRTEEETEAWVGPITAVGKGESGSSDSRTNGYASSLQLSRIWKRPPFLEPALDQTVSEAGWGRRSGGGCRKPDSPREYPDFHVKSLDMKCWRHINQDRLSPTFTRLGLLSAAQ